MSDGPSDAPSTPATPAADPVPSSTPSSGSSSAHPSALSAATGLGDRLRCGAEIDELLEQVAEGRGDRHSAHQRQCPHCQAALAEYDRLWAPVRRAAQTPVHAPDSVLAEALRRIRGAAADPEYASLPGPTGTTRISARVVVTTARESAQAVTGVRVALSKVAAPGTTPTVGDGSARRAPLSLSPEAPPAVGGDVPAPHAGDPRAPADGLRVDAGVSGRSTVVEIVLAADYGTDLHALGDRIRGEVAANVRRLTGLEPVAVHVRIDDVFT